MVAKAIAIIDDEIDLVNLFQEILESDGYKVCAFIDPIQAFNTLEKKIKEYGLILSDFRMPNLNGYELCSRLRQLNPELEVILMSAYDTIECDTSKFTIVKKPILVAQLLQIVRDSLLGRNTYTMTKKVKQNKKFVKY
ncbi:MAG: response regulator [Nitrososphaeraceae archaeon]